MQIYRFGDIHVPKRFFYYPIFEALKNPAQIKAFATHLRRLREKADMSQEDLANLSALSKKTVQRIENANTVASLDTLVSLSEALEIPLKKLVDF